MPTNGQESVEVFPGEDYELNLHIRVTGFGKTEQMYRTAQTIKRILETRLQREVDVQIPAADGVYRIVDLDDYPKGF